MDQAVYQAISRAIDEKFRWGSLWALLLAVVATLVIGYLTAYLKRRGENLATKSDFDMLKEQLAENTKVTEQIRADFAQSMTIFQSSRAWKEQSVSKLLGPMYIQLDRTKRAFDRWSTQNLYLEAAIVRTANTEIRDLLLSNAHLIPSELLGAAGDLIEHYDRWLEEFEKKRAAETPDLKTTFIFVGPQGYPFPKEAEQQFRQKFKEFWGELYDTTPGRITALQT